VHTSSPALRDDFKLTAGIFELLRDLLHQVGDYVLVKTLVPREEEDDKISDGVQCYVPGIVQVVPLRKAPATKCYTILRYNGKKVSGNLRVRSFGVFRIRIRISLFQALSQ